MAPWRVTRGALVIDSAKSAVITSLISRFHLLSAISVVTERGRRLEVRHLHGLAALVSSSDILLCFVFKLI